MHAQKKKNDAVRSFGNDGVNNRLLLLFRVRVRFLTLLLPLIFFFSLTTFGPLVSAASMIARWDKGVDENKTWNNDVTKTDVRRNNVGRKERQGLKKDEKKNAG